MTVIEFMDQLIPGTDTDLVNILQKRMSKKGMKFLLKTKVTQMETKANNIHVSMENEHTTDKPLLFQQILVSIGHKPNKTKLIQKKQTCI